jgi:GH43 family beta-xylosidase
MTQKATARFVCCIWLAAFFSPALCAQPGRLTNPVVDHPDPFITRYGGNYILLATTGNNITLWSNPRLENLRSSPKVVWTPSSNDPLQKQLTQVWSPTLWRFGQHWWIYFTATTDGGNSGHSIFALESQGSNPLGSYAFAGRVETGQPSIDPSLLRAGGKSYLMFVSVTGGHNAVWIAPLSTPRTLAGKANLLIYPDQPWEQAGWPVAEGPTALYHAGHIFIVYSGSHTASPAYCLGLLTYSGKGDVNNPSNWRKSGPVLQQNPEDGVFGPGRGTFTTSPDGRENWILYAAKTTGKFTGEGRTVRAQQFTYDASGMPNFGKPVSLGAMLAAPSNKTPR